MRSYGYLDGLFLTEVGRIARSGSRDGIGIKKCRIDSLAMRKVATPVRMGWNYMWCLVASNCLEGAIIFDLERNFDPLTMDLSDYEIMILLSVH